MKLAENLIIDPVDYVNQGNSFIGIRNSGKTHGAMKTAEELMDAHMPIVAFDPTGIWHNLRIGIEGNTGYPIIVVGGFYADIPLVKDTAVETCRQVMKAALETRASVVFDLKHKETSTKTIWRNIVLAVVELLNEENMSYGLRHVYIEEAAEFIPQKINPGGQFVYSAIESMARMGRNFGLGYTLINQRAEEISKAIFEICDQVFIFRQAGKNSLTSIDKWLDKRGIKGTVPLEELPRLAAGECFSVNEKEELKCKFLPKKTFHPDPKKQNQEMPQYVHTMDRQDLINKIMDSLAEQEEPEKKKSAPHASDKKIKELEDVIHHLKSMIDDKNVELRQLRTVVGAVTAAIATVNGQPIENVPTLDRWNGTMERTSESGEKKMVKVEKHMNIPDVQLQIAEEVEQQLEEKAKTKPAQTVTAGLRMLRACAMFPTGISRKKMCLIAGVKSSGSTYRSGMAWMRREAYITENGDTVHITKLGMMEAGPIEIPTDLVIYWKKLLSGSAQRALIALNKVHPHTITRNQLAGMINTEPSGSTMRAVMAILRKSNIIQENGQNIKLSPELKS